MLEVNEKFPAFELLNKEGKTCSLEDYSGQWLIIFFYSKDGTSACTKEVDTFGEQQNTFTKENATIIGISGDSIKTHANFSQKHNIKYDLLSDPGRNFINSIGLLKDKKMYGKAVKGVVRSTFILDPKGIIKALWTAVKVDGHVEEVLQKLKDLKNKNH